MGLDSLMGVELAVAIESRFGIKLPAMVINENPNLRKLADYFIGQLRTSVKDAPLDMITEGVARMQQALGQDAKTLNIEKAVEVIHTLKSDRES